MTRHCRRVWTREAIKDLQRLYPYRYNDELSEIFHRSAGAIVVKANKLGLKKEKTLIRAAGFQKGYIPFSKGRKMESWLSPEVLQKIKANQAHTAERNKQRALPDGSMTTRYNGAYIKIDGHWVKYAHHVWQQAFGPIPSNQAIYFKDGDNTNCNLSNLFLGRKADPTLVLQIKTPEELAMIRKKQVMSRKRNQDTAIKRKNKTLDILFEHIQKSNNNLSYKIPASVFQNENR